MGITDLTERKEREQALQARSAAMDASIDGMAILNTDGEYTFVNQAHADVYGYEEPNAFLGESWRMCYDEAEINRFESTVMSALRENGSWRGEAVGLREDGSTFPQELSLAMTDDERIICVVRDITERKQREQELENQNMRLEEFARTISHDLRNPLNVAAGQVELAREDCDSESLAAATRALERSETLIDELLTLARQGERVSDLESVSLATTVGRCWQNVATADATLVMNTEQTIRADPTRLAQLCENLIRNAIEHGGEEVSVTVGELENGFYVADDGPGIPPDDRESVFESGYSTAANGTGFGLSIVSEIADAHGWDVTVTESEAGGARFEITGVESTVN
jgi:PAS domain S-box-containing protein